jgi:hypothetical protein
MSFSIGNNVIHKKKPEWGIGIITNVIDQLKLKVVFKNQVEKTITNASDFLAIVTSNTCILCLKECQHDEILSNGWSYHKVCYDNELSIIKKHSSTKINNLLMNMEIQRIVDENKRIEQQIKDKKILVRKYRNLLYSLVIGTFKHVSVGKELNEIVSMENLINENVSNIDKTSSGIINLTDTELVCLKTSEFRLSMLYDYWLSRPPDWETRREQVLSGSLCDNCGQGYNLHVHHIIPISKGGCYKADNLMILCEKCHSIEHGNRAFKYEEDDYDNETVSISSFEKKLKLIRKAIENENNIEFKYKKYNGEISHRKILPKKIRKSGYMAHNNNSNCSKDNKIIDQHNYGNLCVEGFCYLRNDERIFAIKYISYLKIKDQENMCDM